MTDETEMRCAPAWVRMLGAGVLLMHSAAALGGPELNAEDTINEARARPTPAAQRGNWVFVPIPIANAFHDGSLANDQYRISAFGGYGAFNLRYYGVGDSTPFADAPLPYEVEGALLQLRGEARLFDGDHWFAGATYQFLDAT